MLEENRATRQTEASQPPEGQEEESRHIQESGQKLLGRREGERVSELLHPPSSGQAHTATRQGEGLVLRTNRVSLEREAGAAEMVSPGLVPAGHSEF